MKKPEKFQRKPKIWWKKRSQKIDTLKNELSQTNPEMKTIKIENQKPKQMINLNIYSTDSVKQCMTTCLFTEFTE